MNPVCLCLIKLDVSVCDLKSCVMEQLSFEEFSSFIYCNTFCTAHSSSLDSVSRLYKRLTYCASINLNLIVDGLERILSTPVK